MKKLSGRIQLKKFLLSSLLFGIALLLFDLLVTDRKTLMDTAGYWTGLAVKALLFALFATLLFKPSSK